MMIMITTGVLKIRKICHARDLWKLAQSCCIYYAHETREIYLVLPYTVDLKTPVDL